MMEHQQTFTSFICCQLESAADRQTRSSSQEEEERREGVRRGGGGEVGWRGESRWEEEGGGGGGLEYRAASLVALFRFKKPPEETSSFNVKIPRQMLLTSAVCSPPYLI